MLHASHYGAHSMATIFFLSFPALLSVLAMEHIAQLPFFVSLWSTQHGCPCRATHGHLLSHFLSVFMLKLLLLPLCLILRMFFHFYLSLNDSWLGVWQIFSLIKFIFNFWLIFHLMFWTITILFFPNLGHMRVIFNYENHRVWIRRGLSISSNLNGLTLDKSSYLPGLQ